MPTIARASVSDASQILALQKRAFESEARLYNDWSILPLTQGLDSLVEEIEKTTVLKAIDGQSIVGSVRATLNNGVCRIGGLIVEPERQRQGLGSALLLAVEAEFSKANRFQLFTESRSEGNIRLYRRHGYEIAETTRLSEHVTLVFMIKHATDA